MGSKVPNGRAEMKVILKHDVNRIRNGFAARSPQLGLVAHGHSPDVARRNVERTILHFLRPLERQGGLERELRDVGLEVTEENEELTVTVMD
jgi:hypothetical protein